MNAIVNVMLSNAVVVAALFAILILLRRWIRNPAVFHGLAVLLLVKLLIPWGWQPTLSVLPHTNVDIAEAQTDEPSPTTEHTDLWYEAAVPSDVDSAHVETEVEAPATLLPVAVVPDTNHSPEPSADRPTWLFRPAILVGLAWLIGTTVWLLIAVRRIVTFRKSLRLASPAPAELQELAGTLACRLGLKRSPEIVLVPGQLSPALWSLGRRPQIVLPQELLDRLDNGERQSLLLHELAHCRRGDHWIRLVELAATGIYWWYPVLWWLRRELRLAEEQCCDAWVVESLPDQRRAYAEALVKTAGWLSAPVIVPGTTGIGSTHRIEERITRIMRDSLAVRVSRGMKVVIGFLAVGVLSCAPMLAHSSAAPGEEAETAIGNDQDPAAAAEGVATEPTTILRGHEDRVLGVALSDDGRTAITSGADGTIRIWDTATGRQKSLVSPPGGGWIYSVAFSPDGKDIIAGETGRVAAYDLATGRETWHYDGARRGTYFKAIHCDRANHFACVGSDGGVYIWDYAEREAPPREIIARRKPDGARLNACCLSPTGSLLALATRTDDAASSQIEVWDLADNVLVRTMIPERGGVEHLEFSPDGTQIVSCGHSTTYGFSYDGSIASPNNEDSVILWDAASGDVVRKFAIDLPPVSPRPPARDLSDDAVEAPGGHIRIAYVAGFTPDGKRLITGERDGTIRIYAVDSGKLLGERRRHKDAVTSLAVSADGRRFVSVSSDRTGLVWDLKDIRDGSASLKWIPLAPLVQANRDTQDASWDWDGRTAAFGSGKPIARVSIPLVIDGSYELQTRAAIVQAKESTTIYLPVTGARNVVLKLRGDNGNTASPTATMLLEGLDPAPQPQLSPSIDVGTEYLLACRIVKSGDRVTVEIRRDDQVLFEWDGPVSRIAEAETMRPGTVQLQTAYYTSSRFTGLRLRMLSGTATPLSPSVSDLRSRHAEWRRQVQFQSTYRLRQGFAEDLEDAFDGKPFQQVTCETRGVFNKMQVGGEELFRVSVNHEEIFDTTDPDIPAHLLFGSHGLQDEVTWKDLKLVYSPRWNNRAERAALTRMSDIPRHDIPTGQLEISPLNPFPGFDRDPLAGEAILGGEAEFQIQSPDDETTIVTITSKLVSDEGSYSQTNVVEFWMGPELPVVRRIHRRIIDSNGDLYLERKSRLSEFHRYPGGFVARRVLFADWFPRQNDVVRVSEWVSTDLGDRTPVEDDFGVTIPAEVSVYGVDLPPSSGRERVLLIPDLVPTF